MAPPCSTFSRARNRHLRTKLRTAEFPQGLPKRSQDCAQANRIARNALDLAEWLARTTNAAIAFENPETSWIWQFLTTDPELVYTDVTFSTCLFGAPYQKHTRLRF